MAKLFGSLNKKTIIRIEQAELALEQEKPMTLRQLFYRLVSKGLIENQRSDYQTLSRDMTKARECDLVPWNWIVDRSRPGYKPAMWENPREFIESVKESYRKDYWDSQPFYVEIWTEKDAIIGTIEGITNEYGIRVRVCRGFASATKAYEIKEHLEYKHYRESKYIRVGYLGDHDPSGRVIETELYNRLREYGAPPFEMERIAIHLEDIKLFNLPPLRVKESDTRAAMFKLVYGDECVELDALPPNELRHRIKEFIESFIDFQLWERAVKAEKAEFESIVDICEKFPTFNKE